MLICQVKMRIVFVKFLLCSWFLTQFWWKQGGSVNVCTSLLVGVSFCSWGINAFELLNFGGFAFKLQSGKARSIPVSCFYIWLLPCFLEVFPEQWIRFYWDKNGESMWSMKKDKYSFQESKAPIELTNRCSR